MVRRMLENSGALGIDADVIAHRMLYPGGPVYRPVIDTFGEQILLDNGRISHQNLGEIVFNNPDKLAQLESIVHPVVIDDIQARVRSTNSPLVVIEAIKLLESGLNEHCDAIWVSHASEAHQFERLVKNRKMQKSEAQQRISSQPPQSEKLACADVVINTESDYFRTWQQTQQALNDKIQAEVFLLNVNNSHNWTTVPPSSLPKEQIAEAWQEYADHESSKLYESLGMTSITPILQDARIFSFLTWRNWNFTATLQHIYTRDKTGKKLDAQFQALQFQNLAQQSEITIIDPEAFNVNDQSPGKYGFSLLHFDDITYPAWLQSAKLATANGQTSVWAKILQQPFEQQRTSISIEH